VAPNASADGIEQGVSMKYGKEAAKLFAQRIHAVLRSPFTV